MDLLVIHEKTGWADLDTPKNSVEITLEIVLGYQKLYKHLLIKVMSEKLG